MRLVTWGPRALFHNCSWGKCWLRFRLRCKLGRGISQSFLRGWGSPGIVELCFILRRIKEVTSVVCVSISVES